MSSLEKPSPSHEIRLLELGFRPFFLLAGLAAVGLMLLWMGLWRGQSGLTDHYGAIGWHSHEMLFGYVVAVISGFLLTAVRNWTGRDTASGGALGVLALLWLGGRLLSAITATPAWLLALIDLSFLPALAFALAGPLWAGANRINRRFVWLLAGMSLANGLVHAEALGWSEHSAATGVRLMLDLVVLLLVWVGGRILPFFVRAAIPGTLARSRPGVENAAIILLLLLIGARTVGSTGLVPALIALAIAVTQLVRLWDWHHPGVWRRPILAILFTGLIWLTAALLLQALSELGLIAPAIAAHALTVGAFGVFTLGMMARVSLGHTGRAMESTTLTNLAFVALNLAALTRVAGPWLLPDWHLAWIMLAGGFWVLAFVLFLIVFTPILLGPRIDAASP